MSLWMCRRRRSASSRCRSSGPKSAIGNSLPYAIVAGFPRVSSPYSANGGEGSANRGKKIGEALRAALRQAARASPKQKGPVMSNLRLRRLGLVVLVFVNLFAQLVLLLVDLLFFFVGEVSAILFAVTADFFVKLRFLALDLGGLAGLQRAVFHAIGDALLLPLLATLDLAFLFVGERGRSRPEQQRSCHHCQNNLSHFCFLR